mmetsp:Transcript_75378/g.176965  ORF Transcript_75378/g.176965 Transcript_75378/m.176965 type:complete len:372 (+) Transcript_75378:216-1331(+)
MFQLSSPKSVKIGRLQRTGYDLTEVCALVRLTFLWSAEFRGADFFRRFASDEVTLHNCLHKAGDALETKESTVGDFCDLWEDRGKNSFYLKDWNLAKLHPEYPFYSVPSYFEDDWLNWYEREHCSDHRFVYWGPAESFTPLHTDILWSFSWSANVVGAKRWWMLPPSAGPALHNAAGKQLFDVRDVDREQFPEFASVESELLVFDQQPGEAVFVPSGWWHQVVNLTDAVSINHNWLNACNIDHTLTLLHNQHNKACRDAEAMEGYPDPLLAQELVELRYLWNFESVFRFLCERLSHETKRVSSLIDADPASWRLEYAALCLGTLERVLGRLRESLEDIGVESTPPPEIAQVPALLAGLQTALTSASRDSEK